LNEIDTLPTLYYMQVLVLFSFPKDLTDAKYPTHSCSWCWRCCTIHYFIVVHRQCS